MKRKTSSSEDIRWAQIDQTKKTENKQIEKKNKVDQKSDWLILENFIQSETWKIALNDVLTQKSFVKLKKDLQERINKGVILFPPVSQVWTAINLSPLEEIKVVILGQDPYIFEGQGHGLSFSVPQGKTIPPSLVNIFKELKNNFPNYKTPTSGNLEKWGKQGVLLLNAVLTVEKGQPGSCSGIGWEQVTSKILSLVNEKKESCVFLLWGQSAQTTLRGIGQIHPRHLVLKSAHPSPKSASFFFKKSHFLQANKFLIVKGRTPVDWNLD